MSGLLTPVMSHGPVVFGQKEMVNGKLFRVRQVEIIHNFANHSGVIAMRLIPKLWRCKYQRHSSME
jgi:hypothetical protein